MTIRITPGLGCSTRPLGSCRLRNFRPCGAPRTPCLLMLLSLRWGMSRDMADQFQRGEPSPVGHRVGILGASRRYAWSLLVPIADHPASRLAEMLPWKWKAGPATLAA